MVDRISFYNPKHSYFFPKEAKTTKIITNGSYCRLLEKDIAKKLGSKYAIACSSGTIALFCLFSYLLGRGKNKTVAAPNFTWKSTVLAAMMARASKINILDCSLEDFNVPPEEIFNDKSDVIVCTDVFGKPCDYYSIGRAAAGRPVIFDSAHSFGAEYNGEPIGKFGNHIFSLSPTKLFTSGEGGIITTNEKDIFEAASCTRDWSGRMQEVTALAALEALNNFDSLLARKLKIVRAYSDFFQKYEFIKLQTTCKAENIDVKSTYKDFCLVFNSEGVRDAYIRHLSENLIDTKVYFEPAEYHIPRGLQGEKTGNKNTMELYKKSVCIPSFVGVDYGKVINVSKQFLINL